MQHNPNNIIKLRTYVFYAGFLSALLLSFLAFVNVANAQNSSLGISSRVPVRGTKVLDGYIVVSTSSGFEVTSTAFQKNMSGVISESPGIELKSSGSEGSYPLQQSGEVMVWVSLANGLIKKGDLITSSPWEGIGMKATSTGPYIGTALEDVKVDNGVDLDQTVTKAHIVIEPGDTTVAAATAAQESKKRTLPFDSSSLTRFVVGSIIVVITIFVSLSYFGRLSRSGVEAIGRNPVAYKKIQFGISVSVILGFLIAIIGIIAALYIMNLG